MEVLTKAIALSVGGIVGVNARYWLRVWANRWITSDFPWATFAVNATGSFAIGFLAVILAQSSPHSHVRLLVITGLLGGYTTFSTFTYDSVTLWQRGEWRISLANAVGSLFVGCVAVILGAAIASTFLQAGPRLNTAMRTKQISQDALRQKAQKKTIVSEAKKTITLSAFEHDADSISSTSRGEPDTP